ncbi:alpha/beta hydrolase [Ulvibacterium sp.]|uniref:alpha/beta hydrolase n=1 Tax=Ulvibacterium sp. TaxID=2665914 RepID=UPI00261C87B9|nr:alpha/beta hydrolase [Ulvibacterium sp.]
MKRFLLFLSLVMAFGSHAQQLALKKGAITDGIKVHDTIADTFALYLPANFDASKKWPVIFVYDMEGRGKQALSMFASAAEEEDYILAASNNIRDSLSIAQNIMISTRMFKKVSSMFPLHKKRVYTAGFSNGARFASLVPTFVKNVQGVISCGATVANTEVLSSKRPFQFIGIVGNSDFNYPEMLALEKTLNKLRFPNQLLVFEGEHQWPNHEYLSMAMEFLTLASMAKGDIPNNSAFIKEVYEKGLVAVNNWVTSQKPLIANGLLDEIIDVFRPHLNIDSLINNKKILKRSKLFKVQNRDQNAIFFKEILIKEDYTYYLEEDVLTYNYNNLGWWNYQMDELKKLDKSAKVFERQMGKRLRGYVNALIEDNIDIIRAESNVDQEALIFLWMLKTITDPYDFSYYLKIISESSKMEDYGTALFYLEELLKKGYQNKKELYNLQNTALLRITPQFNDIVEKYLKEARYDIIDE